MAKNHPNHTDEPPESHDPQTPGAPSEQPSFVDKVKENSLKNAGWAYLLADAALFTSGMMSKRYREAITGLSWAVGSATIARYGKLDGERELKKLNKDLSAYLKKEGVELPDHGDLSSETLAKPGGIIDKIEDFLYAHPSQVLNAIYAYGGSQLAYSGIQHGKHADLAAGSLVAAGGLAGLLVPQAEKKFEHTGNIVVDAKHWFQEKPLRISGGLYMLNNFALLYSGLKERQANPEQYSYMFKLFTAATFMVANTLLSMSSKDAHSGEGSEVDTSILAKSAATLIARQPKDIQHDLIQRVSGYLATEETIEMTSEEIASKLTQAIDAHRPDKSKSHHKTEHTGQSWKDRTSEVLQSSNLSKA